MRAIVVDDSRTMRTLLRSVLREAGVEVVAEAENGRDALAALAKLGPVELMLLDWNMPVMNGYELLLEVRANQRMASMRLMMVTTETEATQILRALEAGADEYLIKPFSRQAIREKLELMGLFE
ncbi:MAG: response regulator [Myxococcota bacterium]